MSGNGNQPDSTAWWKSRADRMVESQIVSRGVRDNDVIRVMKNTPRHKFIPADLRDQAYNDHPLPIGSGQTISQPYIVALMTEYLQLTGTEKVLEIGTGSGYQAAVLSPLVDTCYSIEVVKTLAMEAAGKLDVLDYDNVIVKWGDGYLGWPEHAPFDRIIITAAPERIPEKLVEQLAVGGRMVLPVGSHFQELILITKTNKGIHKKTIIPVRFVPMVHPDQPIPDK
jgi:protein-L-isoaspartate(D-aspartate) O-methyltransferase